MKQYREPNWEELYIAEFQGAQRKRHEPIVDVETGLVYPNQHDLELFVSDDGLTALGRHLAETGEGGPVMTPDGMRFMLRDRRKTRGYWEDRARVFEMGQDEQVEHSERAAPTRRVEEPQSNGAKKPEDFEAECPQCAGAGLLDDEDLCPVCNGYGMLLVHDE